MRKTILLILASTCVFFLAGILVRVSSPITPVAVKKNRSAVRPANTAGPLVDLQRNLIPTLATAEVVTLLQSLREQLLALDKGEAVGRITAFLDSKLDAKTGQMFTVGKQGLLTGAPTLRVWLLDLLSQIDVVAAAKYSQVIYTSHESADEWALALRNDWNGSDATGKIENIRARLLEMISDENWSREPSMGFLEALDLSVALLTWEAVPKFEQWLDPSQPKALRVAAWLVLDRLTMEGPRDFIPYLVTHTELLESQPLLRAGLVARADLGDKTERLAVEKYLGGKLSKLEATKFLELLPNVNSTVSDNLVTNARVISPNQAAQRDQASLIAVREWLLQDRYAKWHKELLAAEVRLVASVASAKRGGFLP